MPKIYKNLIKAERTKNNVVNHHVATHWGGEEDYQYQSIRIGLVFGTIDNPSYFVVGGLEKDDRLSPILRPTLRIIQEEEIPDLSWDRLFDSVTDSYFSMFCDATYIDSKPSEEHWLKFWDYIDKHNLRGFNLQDVPFKDMVLRFGMLRDYNDSGALVLDKSSSLFSDIQGVSRSNLKDSPEKWYRLNAISYLISGFEKFQPSKPFDMKSFVSKGGEQGWMNY